MTPRANICTTPPSLCVTCSAPLRLALGCAVLHEPPILFLDEPTSGVDPNSRRRFWDLIHGLAAGGVTVLVTTHYMEEAEYCDRLGVVYRGELAALGTPAELKAGLMREPVVGVECARPQDALAVVEALPSVREAALHGQSLFHGRGDLRRAESQPGAVERQHDDENNPRLPARWKPHIDPSQRITHYQTKYSDLETQPQRIGQHGKPESVEHLEPMFDATPLAHGGIAVKADHPHHPQWRQEKQTHGNRQRRG